MRAVRREGLSVRRLARSFELSVSRVGRWIQERSPGQAGRRGRRPGVAEELREVIKALCLQERYQLYGYRRIWALLRRQGGRLNRKTVYRVMRAEGLTRPRVWHRPYRPKRVEKMRPVRTGQAWQVDMTSLQLADLSGLFLVVVTDCFSREIVGWTLDRRCRAPEWTAAVRMALESQGWRRKGDIDGLTLRSDNGAQPCSKHFVEYLGTVGIRGQYTGYNAPDDNAVVERVIRTVKEEEIWLNQYETWAEAHAALDAYIRFYNEERIHSALGYLTPREFAAAHSTLKAA